MTDGIVPPMYSCKKCGIEYPRTEEFFYKAKTCRDGLRGSCKKCRDAYVNDWCDNNRERRREIVNRWDDIHADSLKRWRDENAEYLRQQKRKYYLENKDSCKKRNKDFALKHPDKMRLYRSRHFAKRRALERSLPNTFTSQDHERMVEYWRGRCAVCGRQLKDLFGTHTEALDHWIPLSSPDCPGTTPTNIVPLCHGLGGCNNFKHKRDPNEWVIERYGKRKGAKVIAKIEAYFEFIKHG